MRGAPRSVLPEGGPGFRPKRCPRILRRMGRLVLRVAAGVAVVFALFWLLSVIVGLLVWGVMIALVVGVVLLGLRMLRSESSDRRR
ncbi:hypothetical protein BDW27_103224 [Nocardiopsis sp. L17-MgMaSL7]|nr:hypothetical protein BDW27_103224 [Nocardiopsis sp. L17-MgMaSL7]